MGLTLREYVIADREIQFVGIERIKKRRRTDTVEPQTDTRRDLAQARQQSRNDQDFHAVRQSQPESSRRRRRIEGFVSRYQRLDAGQRGPHRLNQCRRARGQAQALRPSRQELVAEQVPQAREVVAHCRLTDADASRSARDATLREQRVEVNQQVQVDATQIDGIDSHYRS